MSLSHCIRTFLIGLALALPGRAQAPTPMPAAAVQVVEGYLVVHLPQEGVTVVGQPATDGTVDSGWATWAQRGELLWRGEMEDGQGRRYNVRILPGYVAPWHFAGEGWTDAGSDLAEYGAADTWTTMGHHARDSFKWGWKTSFWKFGLKGSGEAWSDNFQKAGQRTARRTFGWPLAYPWAFIASAFESALRLPLGVAGAALGTAGAVVDPVVETTWPALKATWHAGVNGVVLPVAAWGWQSVAAPLAVPFASAPTPARADGTWMKLMPPSTPQPTEAVPDSVVADLTRYAAQTAALDADAGTSLVDLRRRERAELDAVRARFAAEAKGVEEARARKLQAWLEEPANREAVERLAQHGGDAATLRRATEPLVQRLVATGLPEAEARGVVQRLLAHPLVPRTQGTSRYDKTDPLRSAVDTVKRVDQDANRSGL
ncbi:MAG TPA: hypothetical protein VJ570_11805 [Holophagaceae bacterium]|nr:hypothetical protein [Holophagaceae bacterium]